MVVGLLESWRVGRATEVVPEAALLRWFESLGYTIERVEIPPGMHHQWALEDEPAGRWRLVHAARHPTDPSFRVLVVVLGAGARQPDDMTDWQGRWAGRLWRRNRTFSGLLVSALPERGEVLVTALFPEGRADRPGLHHVRLMPERARPAEVERLSRLAVRPEDTSAEALTARLRSDLDLRAVTRRFFVDLRRAFEGLVAGIEGGRGLDEAQRRDLALVTLSRLLFIAFVQRKGLMDGREDFLWSERRRVMRTGGGLYGRLLRPLFFGVLNTPEEARSPEALALGAIPYLNGGLFEPGPRERRGPWLGFSDAAVVGVFEGVLERYAFTTREDGSGVGVDPEMLGKVFESLMAASERGQSGTFYTPRAVVDTLVEQGLRSLLARFGAAEMEIEALMSPEAETVLAPARAALILSRLDDAAILDPACGSGAFLMGVLGRLEGLWSKLAAQSGQAVPEPWVLRRRIIARNLHGIDLDRSAVRLCELRLWLAILDAQPAGTLIEPLPNLDCRVRQGDALVEPLDWAVSTSDLRVVAERVRSLEALKADYGRAPGGPRRFLRHHLEQAERALLRELAERHLSRLRRERDGLRAAEAAVLPGIEPKQRVHTRRAWLALDEQIDRLEETLAKIDDRDQSPGLTPWVHFPEVMSRGGFDLVVTNPPWVRIHAVAPERREVLRRRYDVIRRPAWTAGGTLRHLKGSGSQVDLAAVFVERSLGLLAPGGVLAALIPSKLVRALYGGGVRRLLATEATPLWVSELGDDTFPDATAYPLAFVALRSPPTRSASVAVAPDFSAPFEVRRVGLRSLRLDADDLGSPWILGTSARGALHTRCVRLGDHPSMSVRRGVMTGLNAAFVGSGACPDEGCVPLVRGADLSAWSWSMEKHLRWTHDRAQGEPLAALSVGQEAALAPHREALLARRGLSRRDPWWRVFRTGPHLFGPRVAWRDIGARLEAVALPSEVEVEGVLRPVVPINTVYFIPVFAHDCALVLAAWLNSAPVRAMAAELGERASGGYQRFFAWVIEMLPLPDALAMALRDPESWAASLRADPSLRGLLTHSRHLHETGLCKTRVAAIDAAVGRLYADGGRS